jgi:hypothetical protein
MIVSNGDKQQQFALNSSLPIVGRALDAKDLQAPAGESLSHLNHLIESAGSLEQLYCSVTIERVKEALRRDFITFEDNKIKLLPLASLPETLIHLGRDTEKTRYAVRYHKVFGDPVQAAPTYLGSPDWRGETNAWSDWDPTLTADQKIMLTIDTAKLLKFRSIYLDPESLQYDQSPAGSKDIMGSMFFVGGGIPLEALRELHYSFIDGKKMSSYWPGIEVI